MPRIIETAPGRFALAAPVALAAPFHEDAWHTHFVPAAPSDFCPEGCCTQAWQPPAGAPYRPLTASEIHDLRLHALTLVDEVLTPALLDDTGAVIRPALTRLADLHAHWDAQHPVFRAVLTQRGLAPT